MRRPLTPNSPAVASTLLNTSGQAESASSASSSRNDDTGFITQCAKRVFPPPRRYTVARHISLRTRPRRRSPPAPSAARPRTFTAARIPSGSIVSVAAPSRSNSSTDTPATATPLPCTRVGSCSRPAISAATSSTKLRPTSSCMSTNTIAALLAGRSATPPSIATGGLTSPRTAPMHEIANATSTNALIWMLLRRRRRRSPSPPAWPSSPPP